MDNNPDSDVHSANMGPIWGRQDPGGPHVGPMNFAIWVSADESHGAVVFISVFYNYFVWLIFHCVHNNIIIDIWCGNVFENLFFYQILPILSTFRFNCLGTELNFGGIVIKYKCPSTEKGVGKFVANVSFVNVYINNPDQVSLRSHHQIWHIRPQPNVLIPIKYQSVIW